MADGRADPNDSLIKKPEVVRYSGIGFGLHFSSLEHEEAYCSETSAKLRKKLRSFRNVVTPLSLVVVSLAGVASGQYYKLEKTFLLNASQMLLLNLVLHLPLKANVEHQLCIVNNIFPCLFFCTNPIRIHRMLPEWFPLPAPITSRVESCHIDALEISADTWRIGALLLTWNFFSAVSPVRSNFQLMYTILFLSLSCCIFFFPPLMPNDSVHSGAKMLNMILIFVGAFSLAYVSYFQDRQNRETWALQNQRDQYAEASTRHKKLQALLHILCPAVVHVRDGQITPVDAVEDLFGERVVTLMDLPTQDSQENLCHEIRDLVDEVHATGGRPLKRKVMVRPRGGAKVFLTTVCAVVEDESVGALVGFEIHDYWETTTGIILPESAETISRPSHESGDTSDISANESELVTDEEDQDEDRDGLGEGLKRVLFDEGSARSGRERTQHARSTGKRKTDRTAKTVMDFRISPMALRIWQSKSQPQVTPSRQIPAQFLSTDVELHRRVDRNAVANEAAVLLACRHPNILFMLGFVYDSGGGWYGPMMVMEKSWGTVSKAIHSRRLTAVASLSIAEQVAAALHFLHTGRGIHHGAVDIGNVVLLNYPSRGRGHVTAKLTNFAKAMRVRTENRTSLAMDIRAYVAFTSNLFVEDFGSVVWLDRCKLGDEQGQIRSNLEAIGTDHPELVALLLNSLSFDFFSSDNVDERFFALLEMLRSSKEQQLEQESSSLRQISKKDSQTLKFQL
jgi:hypothetical protein